MPHKSHSSKRSTLQQSPGQTSTDIFQMLLELLHVLVGLLLALTEVIHKNATNDICF